MRRKATADETARACTKPHAVQAIPASEMQSTAKQTRIHIGAKHRDAPRGAGVWRAARIRHLHVLTSMPCIAGEIRANRDCERHAAIM